MAGGGVVRLLLLGVLFHALCIFSIFDIYFQSPVESSIPSANYTSSPPARRVIVFTVDGCRVDKLYKATAGYTDRFNRDPDSATTAKDLPSGRAPFLGDVMRRRGSWGVSHNHVPTESRPCHVALTAGMYEDPHAVTKNWKQHPVPFDSVFNQSNNAFIFGNRDVAPMLARHAPHAQEEHYSAREENEMAREDPSLLDVWSFRKMKALFAQGTEKRDAELHAQLNQDKLVIYCHFLGTDLSGPKYGAHSREYLENIAVVDELVEKTEKMVETYFGHDGRTAYVLNSDHGMDARGNHGDDDPAKSRTAIVAWGAGIQGAIAVNVTDGKRFDIDLPTQSRAEVQKRLEAQEREEQVAEREWATLIRFERKDVMQTDVAPLISALAGLPYPRNSVGVLPFTYLTKNKYRANAVRANAQQLYQHAMRKEEIKRAHRGWLFVPYTPLRSRALELAGKIDDALRDISDNGNEPRHDEAHRLVETLSQEMINICRIAIVYYQKYDWMFLFGSIILGYIGLALVMVVAYINPVRFRLRWLLTQTIDFKTAVTRATHGNPSVQVVRLVQVLLAFAPSFALLSTAYEMLFYLALCTMLVSWLLLEAEYVFSSIPVVERETHRALIFLLLVQISFFGTSSVTSMTDFRISSATRFLTSSSAFIAQALVVLKLLVPFIVVACTFRLILLLPSRVEGSSIWEKKDMKCDRHLPMSRYFLLAAVMADVLAVRFLFLVNNEGSWKQMGNSIAVFCIGNAQIVLLPTVALLAWFFIHDLEPRDEYEPVDTRESDKAC
ncbi:hypothetical protein PHYBOEH_005113 [Phytophthora boehmeriae]|uniref:GPI ethanolamine phosphate transferase 1 n=1 Tax=Phytophthora boehmeriae TaxID=109152 RepID=A0A8T1XB03_9STRA|nr:hypothetical protein PHYBOEH_005113 [Phytophthora boehmeriae]